MLGFGRRGTAPQQEDDESFVSHLVELRSRVMRSLVVVLIMFGVCFYFAPDIMRFLAIPLNKALPEGSKAVFIAGEGAFFTLTKIAFLTAILVSLPWVLYQAWAFVAPGLYAHERRFALPLVISSVVFLVIGISFAYYFVLPAAYHFFFAFAERTGADVMQDLQRYWDFTLAIFFGFGITFERIGTLQCDDGGHPFREIRERQRPSLPHRQIVCIGPAQLVHGRHHLQPPLTRTSGVARLEHIAGEYLGTHAGRPHAVERDVEAPVGAVFEVGSLIQNLQDGVAVGVEERETIHGTILMVMHVAILWAVRGVEMLQAHDGAGPKTAEDCRGRPGILPGPGGLGLPPVLLRRLLQRPQDLLRRDGELADTRPHRIVDGVGDGRCAGDHGGLAKPFGAKRSCRLYALHQNRHHLRGVDRPRNLVVAIAGIEHLPILNDQSLGQRISYTHG